MPKRHAPRHPYGLGTPAAVLLLVALTVLAVGLAAWHWYESVVPMSAERVEVRVPAGASARAIARQLRAAGVKVHEDGFVAVARLTDATLRLRAGRYEFERGMTLHQIIDKLARGEVLRERLTLVEGWTVRDLRAALAAASELRQDSVGLDDRALLKAIGATEAHPEGLFAPDTYLYDPGSSDLDLLRQAYRMQAQRLAAAWESRAPQLPYKSPYDALIMASIVEKETGREADRARVAAVFVNRLKRGMMLQSDPTTIYGLGEAFDGNLRRRDLVADTPYNTYTRGGLTPTPISMPGRASIVAALDPAPIAALYFVARGDGTSEFSNDLAAHNRAVARYPKQRAAQ